LARWRTPSGEYIPPGRFVPIAEQTGLISPLGSKVFQLAAEQACCWRSSGLNTNIAVNVSPHQLRRPRFVDQLKSILSETGAQAEWFELEITENAVMEDVAQAVRIMDELSALGFRIAIDDFGTGYSSLSYLKNFSIHTLKIDLSFVRDLMRDDHSDAIVRSIISLGSGMKLTLVAEGVETQEQANFLREAGCDVLQGYLIGKPVPQQQYLQWLSAR
jgi:EAL domain-containing protein (putative c-di-GMP-specific phosphodiesterase class I)